MSSVIKFDKSIRPMVLYDLISIFMNIYVNIKKEGKLFKNSVNLGDRELIRPTLHPEDIFSCMPKCLVGPPEYKKIVSLKTHLEHMNFHGFHGNPSWILKNADVWGLLLNNLALMKNCQGEGGMGMQGKLNCTRKFDKTQP